MLTLRSVRKEADTLNVPETGVLPFLSTVAPTRDITRISSFEPFSEFGSRTP